MTDKIITDGVNVYECNHYIRGECIAEYYLENGYEIRNFFDCDDNHNCYYKQFQRKTAECEELKKKYEDILDSRQREWEEEYEIYEQALNEIEKIMEEVCGNCETQYTKWCNKDCREFLILDIINKAKDGEL